MSDRFSRRISAGLGGLGRQIGEIMDKLGGTSPKELKKKLLGIYTDPADKSEDRRALR